MQVPRYPLFPLACVTLEPHRVRPTQISTFFGQKIEEGLQRRYSSSDRCWFQPASTLLIDKLVYVVHINFSPNFLTNVSKLSHIAQIIQRRPTPRKSSSQIFFKLNNNI